MGPPSSEINVTSNMAKDLPDSKEPSQNSEISMKMSTSCGIGPGRSTRTGTSYPFPGRHIEVPFCHSTLQHNCICIKSDDNSSNCLNTGIWNTYAHGQNTVDWRLS
jgi:hypothetical protein